MTIQVNGDLREVPDGITLRALAEQFNLRPEKIAIELNKRLVRSEKYDLPLQPNDQIELVTFVGGG
jgi:sulfur carrier protein